MLLGRGPLSVGAPEPGTRSLEEKRGGLHGAGGPCPGLEGVRGQRGRARGSWDAEAGRRVVVEIGASGEVRWNVEEEKGLAAPRRSPCSPPASPPSTAGQGERAAASHDGPPAHAALRAQALQSTSEWPPLPAPSRNPPALQPRPSGPPPAKPVSAPAPLLTAEPSVRLLLILQGDRLCSRLVPRWPRAPPHLSCCPCHPPKASRPGFRLPAQRGPRPPEEQRQVLLPHLLR